MFGGLAVVPGILEFFVWVFAAFASLTLLRRSKPAMVLLLGAASCFFLRIGTLAVFLGWSFRLLPSFGSADLALVAALQVLPALLHALELALLAAAILVDREPPFGRPRDAAHRVGGAPGPEAPRQHISQNAHS